MSFVRSFRYKKQVQNHQPPADIFSGDHAAYLSDRI